MESNPGSGVVIRSPLSFGFRTLVGKKARCKVGERTFIIVEDQPKAIALLLLAVRLSKLLGRNDCTRSRALVVAVRMSWNPTIAQTVSFKLRGFGH